MQPLPHTPGPWALSEPYDDDCVTVVLGYGEPRGAQFEEEALAEIWGMNLSPDEFRANARLIVAAPELLKIARIFLGEDKRFQIAVGGNPNAVDKMLDAARAVVAKAIGEAVA